MLEIQQSSVHLSPSDTFKIYEPSGSNTFTVNLDLKSHKIFVVLRLLQNNSKTIFRAVDRPNIYERRTIERKYIK